MRFIYPLLERDLLPDFAIRFGIRRLLARRLQDVDPKDVKARESQLAELVESLRQGPLAVHTKDANEQHYEVPTEFFERVLGPHMKYSSGYWPGGTNTLADSEQAMLELSVERAQLQDGQEILELGCGWGSLTLFMAKRFPQARILAISNSRTQREHILGKARERGLTNIEVETVDMNDFETDRRFDRVVSIEMFEHMRNYELLLNRIASWLQPDGKLFVHIFCHRHVAYPFEVRDDSDWMAKYFFTGGMMPSADLLTRFESPLELEKRWLVNGEHYARTSFAWLEEMDAKKTELLPILKQTYGSDQLTRWWVYWRVFFLSCAELFAYNQGEEWMVGHFLFHSPEHSSDI